jgi:hypothetical protein
MGGLYDRRRATLSIGGPSDRLAFEDGRTGRPQSEDDTMAQFMLLLHENPGDFADVSPAEIQRVIGEYTAWRERLEAAGFWSAVAS